MDGVSITLALGSAVAFLATILAARNLSDWISSTLPEFLGAFVIALVVRMYLRENARQKYIRAMRSVREAVKEQQLEAERVQQLMIRIVPSVSVLHFGTKEPELGTVPVLARDHCGTCRTKGQPVVSGRCAHCADIVESWGDTYNPASGN